VQLANELGVFSRQRDVQDERLHVEAVPQERPPGIRDGLSHIARQRGLCSFERLPSGLDRRRIALDRGHLLLLSLGDASHMARDLDVFTREESFKRRLRDDSVACLLLWRRLLDVSTNARIPTMLSAIQRSSRTVAHYSSEAVRLIAQFQNEHPEANQRRLPVVQTAEWYLAAHGRWSGSTVRIYGLALEQEVRSLLDYDTFDPNSAEGQILQRLRNNRPASIKKAKQLEKEGIPLPRLCLKVACSRVRPRPPFRHVQSVQA
jgi:hypothetical protein